MLIVEELSLIGPIQLIVTVERGRTIVYIQQYGWSTDVPYEQLPTIGSRSQYRAVVIKLAVVRTPVFLDELMIVDGICQEHVILWIITRPNVQVFAIL